MAQIRITPEELRDAADFLAQRLEAINTEVASLHDYFQYRDTAPTLKDTAEAIEATTGLFGNMDFFTPFDDYGTKTGKTISDIIELFAS